MDNLERKLFENRVTNKHPLLKGCDIFNVVDDKNLFLLLDICEVELNLFEIQYLNGLIKKFPKYVSLQPKRYQPKENTKKQGIYFLNFGKIDQEVKYGSPTMPEITISINSREMTFNDINGPLSRINDLLRDRIFVDIKKFEIDKNINHLSEMYIQQASSEIYNSAGRGGTPIVIKTHRENKTIAVVTNKGTTDIESLAVFSPSRIYRTKKDWLSFEAGYFLTPNVKDRIYIYETNDNIYEEIELYE